MMLGSPTRLLDAGNAAAGWTPQKTLRAFSSILLSTSHMIGTPKGCHRRALGTGPKNGEGPPVNVRRPFACYQDLWIVIASPMSWTTNDMIRSWRSPGFLFIALPPSS